MQEFLLLPRREFEDLRARAKKKKKNSEKHSRKTWASILAQESGDGGDLTRENRQLAAHEDVDNF